VGKGITSVGLTILYAPILPITALIGFVGIFIQYVVDQYLALRHSLRPRAFQVEAFNGANNFLGLLQLFQLLLILAFCFGEIAAIPSVVGLVIVRNQLARNQLHGQCYHPNSHVML
jgi:hypothetical protein